LCDLRNINTDLAGKRIILLPTHIVSDVEASGNEILLVGEGQLVELARPKKLNAVLDGKVWEWHMANIKIRFRPPLFQTNVARRALSKAQQGCPRQVAPTPLLKRKFI
jgi:ABC-type multidrug transport system ATPase subunit